jgi:hypothetical protein
MLRALSLTFVAVSHFGTLAKFVAQATVARQRTAAAKSVEANVLSVTTRCFLLKMSVADSDLTFGTCPEPDQQEESLSV